MIIRIIISSSPCLSSYLLSRGSLFSSACKNSSNNMFKKGWPWMAQHLPKKSQGSFSCFFSSLHLSKPKTTPPGKFRESRPTHHRRGFVQFNRSPSASWGLFWVDVAGAWQNALELYFRMSPDTISSNVTISACGRAGQWQHALSHGCMLNKVMDARTNQRWLKLIETLGDFSQVYLADGKSMIISPKILDAFNLII